MELKTISFAREPISFVAPSWSDLDTLALGVAQQIRHQQLGFDRIVTLAKGGWPMTRSLVDYLQIAEVASIGVKFYAGINQRLAQPEIYQEIPVSVHHESVLLFDDVADTGESLLFTKDHLIKAGVKQVTTATLFFKPHSQITPDFFGTATNDWIIFPYDSVETIQVLGKKWTDQGLDQSEIAGRFARLQIKQKVIDSYYDQK